VTTSEHFTQHPERLEDIINKLKVGAFPPEFLAGYAAGVDPPGVPGVTVYHKTGLGYTIDTIFKVTDETDEFVDFGDEYKSTSEPMVGVLYLKNVVSNIAIGDPTNTYFISPERKPLVLRNPIMFHDLTLPEVRDSHYEIDAVIHHLTAHPNSAPFVCLQLIQHFGIANPSPGMIERVATVYKQGMFSSNSNTYGDGRYSSLSAVV